LTIFAGTPTTVQLSGIDLRTTEFAPILTFSPIIMFPRTLAPLPTTTLFFSVGCRFPVSLPVPPNVAP